MENKPKRVNFRISNDMHKALKVAAANEGVSITVFMINLIINELYKQEIVEIDENE